MLYEKLFLFVCAVFSSSQCSPVFNKENLYTTSDPDTYLSPPKIIRRNGYRAESHIIESDDGYLLEYHRIPRGKNHRAATKRYPILIHHGLLTTSFDWIMNGPAKSIGYRFADEGYDVWLGNARGNTFSRSHKSLTPNDKQFWDFSFYEMGVNDLSAAIDYILYVTNSSRLVYIGHSQGTTMFYTLMSTKPEYNAKVLVHVGMAPVAMLGHTTSSFRLLVPFAKQIQSVFEWYAKGAFLEHDVMSTKFAKFLCGMSIFDYNLCEQLIIFKLTGKDAEQFDKSKLPLIISHMPAGTSVKNMVHCSQLIASSQFANYDYGAKENILRYGSARPPAYNISKISVPIKFYYGENDILADPLDVKLLYQQFPKPMGCQVIDYAKWNHVDFVWAIEINKYFNDEMIEFVNNCTQNANFISEQVAKNLKERLDSPTPIDQPFDIESFMNNDFNGLPTLGNVTQLMAELDKRNVVEGYTNQWRETMQQQIDKVKNELTDNVTRVRKGIDETIYKTGRSIFETADKVHEAIEVNVSNAKKTFDRSVQNVNTRMKELITKLSQGFA